MIHKYILYLIVFLALLLILPFANKAIAASADDARQFVDTLGKQVLETINNKNNSEEQKQQALQKMFLDNMDIDWMGRFTLGIGWRQATKEQRDRYMQVYRQYLLARYTENFTDYTGSKYNITNVGSEAQGQFTVTMHIKTPQQSAETEAGYTVHTTQDGRFKITDIIVEGVSMITTQRADFTSVFQKNGIDGLIAEIQDKMQRAKTMRSD